MPAARSADKPGIYDALQPESVNPHRGGRARPRKPAVAEAIRNKDAQISMLRKERVAQYKSRRKPERGSPVSRTMATTAKVKRMGAKSCVRASARAARLAQKRGRIRPLSTPARTRRKRKKAL